MLAGFVWFTERFQISPVVAASHGGTCSARGAGLDQKVRDGFSMESVLDKPDAEGGVTVQPKPGFVRAEKASRNWFALAPGGRWPQV